MGAQDVIFIRTRLRLSEMGCFKGILYRNLVLLAGIFWVFFRAARTALFDLVNRTMFSFRYVTTESGDRPATVSSKVSEEGFSDDVVRAGEQVYPIGSNCSVNDEEGNPGALEVGEEVSILDQSEGKDSPKFLSFRFPSLEEYAKSGFNREGRSKPGESPEASCSGRSPSNEELSIDCEDDSLQSEDEGIRGKKLSWESLGIELIEGEPTQEVLQKEDISEITEKFRWLSEKEFLVSESDSDSMSSSHDFSLMSCLQDSNCQEGFLADGYFDYEVSKLNNIPNLSTTKEKLKSDASSEEDDDMEFEDCEGRENTPENDSSGDENSKSKSSDQSAAWDTEEDSKLESMWEHQDLIEQIKMELEKARRATGLPTIPEDSEGPNITEDLKPWKMDDRVQHKETIGELRKVYMSYCDRMRKFDILNYQKIYALGFLQAKDPIGFASTQKPTSEGMTSLLSQTFKMCRDKKPWYDPVAIFVRELQGDLEMVYVGQMCLSWEFLHWQYMKALELWESDHDNSRQYNMVAGEFQQFQVVLQRFLENERFEGPRVECYIRTRHLLRNLLQIPVIKEDSLKDKRRAEFKERGEYAVRSDELIQMLEESIRTFWQFVRADKDSNHAFQRCRKGSKPKLLNPKDSELLAEAQLMLRKKEKQLKEILKGRNCILRKFQKNLDDDGSDRVLYFFSQVDMKLVRRVLNMSRLTTDQISWCCSKLSRIRFVRRKIHVEPSFSLFPC